MNNSEDLDDLQVFALPEGPRHPADIAARLMLDPEHAHLADNEISIGYLMRLHAKEKGGKVELGSMHDAKYMAQGGFKELFTQLLTGMLGFSPQFVMVLDRDWWLQASELEQEALVWHELCHCKQKLDKYGAPKFGLDGTPSYGIVEHDVTAFRSEVAKYGAWSPDLREFLAVANRSA